MPFISSARSSFGPQGRFSKRLNIKTGLSSNDPGDSAVQIKTDYPSSSNGFYYININGTTRYIYCDMTTDSGGWMLVYELTNPQRGAISENLFSYVTDNSSWFGSGFSFSRVSYRMQNNMGNGGTSYYSWASMDKWSGLTPITIKPPDIGNSYTFQTNTSNLFVDTNYNQSWVTNRNSGDTARIEIWPSNYGTGPGTYSDGDNGVYDHDDSGFSTSMGYGCFQIFNLNTGLSNNIQAVLAWNTHTAALPNQSIGFGRNVSGNPFYDSTGTADWTFADNGAYNFKLQGWIK